MKKNIPPRLILIPALLLSIYGCKGRERANPLDPMNPETGGLPENFNAVAGNSEVLLEWTDLGFADLAGYEILRVEEETGESTIVNTDPIPPMQYSLTDPEVINAHTYSYTLFFLAPGGLPSPSVPDVATPDPTTVWAADFGSPSLRKISPDARDLVRRISGLSGPLDLRISPGGEAIWVADYFSGEARKYDLEGTLMLTLDRSAAGRGLPVCLDIDPRDLSLWIGGRSPDGVSRIDDLGTELAWYPSIGDPVDIAVNSSNGTTWIASRDGNAVFRKLRTDEDFTSIPGFSRPASIACDPASGRCWIADERGITVIEEGGETAFRLEAFDSPRAVAIDLSDGSCWIAETDGSGTIHHIDPMGVLILSVGGFQAVTDMAVDPSTGNCWLTNVTSLEGEVVKVSPEGRILGRVGRLVDPEAISLLP